jgi:hypothetical protein
MRSRRLPFALTAVVLSLTVAPATFAADDDLPEVNRAAPFSVSDVALAESGLPKDGGFKPAPDGAPPAPDAKAIADFLASTVGTRSSITFSVTRSFVTADGKPVTLVLADVAGDPEKVAAAVAEEAPKKGWSSRVIALPSRLAVVAGPEEARTKILDAQGAFALRLLLIKFDALVEMERESQAYAYAGAILKLEPKHAGAHLVAADGISQRGQKNQDAEMGAKAGPHFKAALDKDAVAPLTGDALTRGKGHYGQWILTSANGAPSAEARDLLLEAVKGLPGKTIKPKDAIGLRYDLACAYARLKELDPAFEHLSKALEENALTPVVPASHWRNDDPDMQNLKADPRWAKLLEKHPAPKEGGGDGGN